MIDLIVGIVFLMAVTIILILAMANMFWALGKVEEVQADKFGERDR